MFDRKQASYVYKKLEQESIINTETMKQRIEQKKLTDTDRENDNPYKRVILKRVYQNEHKTTQMENWTILSNNVRYVQHDEK